MPRFRYVTQATKGAPFVSADADANSERELNARLINLNQPVIRVFAIARKRPKHRRIKLRFKLLFIEQLETSLYLGMDFRTALATCLRIAPKRTADQRASAQIIEGLQEQVSRGVSFSQAAAHYPGVFDPVALGLISAGEQGGTLTDSLTNVRRIWARSDELQHRLIAMSIYPAIVTLVAGAVVWLLMTRVVPEFVRVLSELNADLPLPTRILIKVSNLFSQSPGLLLGGIVLLSLGFFRLPAFVRASPRLHRFVLRLPILGRLTLLLIQANFARTFAQLKLAKARTTEALALCRDLTWNYEYRAAIARTVIRVHRGDSLAAAFADELEVFGDLVVNGLTFMEASGANAEALLRLNTLLERELDTRLTAARQIMEPVVIIILGVIVGSIVFATFLPAIQIMQKI
jgi:type II secretory pathway component PulF